MAEKKKTKALLFKGKPLVRCDNTIYYGDMADPYVARLQIGDTVAFENLKLPTKISVQILSTDEELNPLNRIKKKTEKQNLYDALNIAAIWLERILENGE